MKKGNLIIIIIFLFMIYIPDIAYLFIENKLDKGNYENRNLYTKPDLTLKNIQTYPKQFENYFNDHVPFKNEIRKLRSFILYDVFDTTSSFRVFKGKNNWLFYNSVQAETPINNKPVDDIADYRKISMLTLKEMESIKDVLVEVDKNLNSQNIQFYVFILPNKENVYENYMPYLINRNNTTTKSRTEKLIDYLSNNTNLNIIYPKDILISSQKEMDTYLKYDTHWNNYGAYLGTTELLKIVNPTFKMPNDIVWSKIPHKGDLANMLMLKDYLIEDDYVASNFMKDINYQCQTGIQFMTCSSNGIYDETIMIIGDSFRNATVQYLAKIYKNSIFIHEDYYKEDLIKKYGIDIVVYESVERRSNSLIDASKLINN